MLHRQCLQQRSQIWDLKLWTPKFGTFLMEKVPIWESKISRYEKLFALKHFIDTFIEYMQLVQILSQPSRHISRSSGLSLDYPHTFLNHPDTFRTIRKLSRSSRHISRSSGLSLDYLNTFLNYPDTFRIARQFPDRQGTVLDHLDSFQIVRTHFRDYPHTFQIVQKLSRSSTLFFRLSGHIFQINWTPLGSSGNFPDHSGASLDPYSWRREYSRFFPLILQGNATKFVACLSTKNVDDEFWQIIVL